MTYSQSCATITINFERLLPPPQRNSMPIRVLSAQLCPALCDPMDCGLPASSVYGISQVRTLDWAPCPPPVDPSDPGIEPASLASPVSLALAGGFFTTVPPGKPYSLHGRKQNTSAYLPETISFDKHS